MSKEKTTKPKTLAKKKMTPKSQNQDAPQDDMKKDLLKGVIAFVDVKAEGIETSDAISKKIEEYGGKVSSKFRKTKSNE